jgi:phytanoyl-CoA hydroxylase
MTAIMTDAQRIAFESQGFLSIPNALSPDELLRVRGELAEVEARWEREPDLPGHKGAALWELRAPINYGGMMRDLLWHPRVFSVVRAVLGDDVAMIDNSYYVTPPRTPYTHADWHHDVALPGVYHPASVMMVKVFFLLTDVDADSGGTAMVPGSHRFPMDFVFPKVDAPKDMPGAVQMIGAAGTAYLFNGRVYHCAVNNDSDSPRKVLIYNYGHHWMKIWPGYEPAPDLLAWALADGDPVKKQLLGLGPAYQTTLEQVGST